MKRVNECEVVLASRKSVECEAATLALLARCGLSGCVATLPWPQKRAYKFGRQRRSVFWGRSGVGRELLASTGPANGEKKSVERRREEEPARRNQKTSMSQAIGKCEQSQDVALSREVGQRPLNDEASWGSRTREAPKGPAFSAVSPWKVRTWCLAGTNTDANPSTEHIQTRCDSISQELQLIHLI